MKWFILILFSALLMSCNRNDQAGAVGSGAGVQKEDVKQVNPETGETEKVERMDAGGEDMNITTPIHDHDHEHED